MNKILGLVIVSASLTLVACQQEVGSYCNEYEDQSAKPYNTIEPTLQLNSFDAIQKYVFNTAYKSDISLFGISDYWQAPQSFIEHKGGDCEDFAIFAMYYLTKIGYDTTFISIDKGNNTYHAIIKIKINGNTFYYEPQTMYFYYDQNPTIVKEYSLDQCLSICYNQFHSRNISDDYIVD